MTFFSLPEADDPLFFPEEVNEVTVDDDDELVGTFFLEDDDFLGFFPFSFVTDSLSSSA